MGLRMATESTVYEVVTRYLFEERGSPDQYRRRLDQLGNSARQADGAMRAFNFGLGTMLRYVGPLALFSAAVAGVRLGFRNLNDEMRNTIGLAAQYNTSFQYSTDPTKNFLASMRQARREGNEVFKAGLRLPATTTELFAAVSAISGVALAAGANREQIRRIAGNLTVVGPMARQNVPDATNQMFRMLTGQVSQGDNPLFAYLLGARKLPGADLLNAMPAAKRLKLVDDALRSLATDDVVDALSRTFDVQWSTLWDQIFGAQGAFGLAMGGDYKGLIDSMKKLNEAIAQNMPILIGFFRQLADMVEWWGGWFKIDASRPATEHPIALGGIASFANKARERLIGDVPMIGNDPAKWPGKQLYNYLKPYYADAMSLKKDRPSFSDIDQAIEDVNARYGDPEHRAMYIPPELLMQRFSAALEANRKKAEEESKVTPSTKSTRVQQTFNIKLDLKSDESPEGIVVRMRKEIQRSMRAPLTPERVIPLGPGLNPVR